MGSQTRAEKVKDFFLEELSNPESVQRRGGFQIKQKQKTLERI